MQEPWHAVRSNCVEQRKGELLAEVGIRALKQNAGPPARLSPRCPPRGQAPRSRPPRSRCETTNAMDVAYYLDTSALVKLVVLEAETAALRAWLQPSLDLVSCDLSRTELVRPVQRIAPIDCRTFGPCSMV